MKKSRWIGILCLISFLFALTASVFARTELKVEVFDRALPGYQPDDNYWTKYVQSKFGDPNDIDVKFVTVPRGQEVDRLNVLMATGDAPDIVFTYDPDVVYNFVKMGGLTDIGSTLDTYGKNLKAWMGKDLVTVGVFDGKQYGIPAKRVLTGMFAGFIRKDWLDTLKMPLPKTRDDFYKALKAFKEKDPGKVGKDKVIPWAISTDLNGNITWGMQLFVDSFKSDAKITEEQVQCYPRWKQAGVKDAVKFLNKMYNEGLLSPDFALDTENGKIADRDTMQGRTGFAMGNFDLPYTTQKGLAIELAKNVPGASLVPVDCFTDKNGKKFKRVYPPNGFYILVPKNSQRAVEAIKYLDWMSQPENLDILLNGVKGTNYTELREGIPVNIQVEGSMRLTTDMALIINGKDYGSLEKNITALSFSYSPELAPLIKTAYKQSLTFDRSYFEMYFPLESNARLKKTLFNKDVELFTKSVTCKPSDFDKVYDQQTKEYMDMGGTEVMNDKIAYYRKNFGGK